MSLTDEQKGGIDKTPVQSLSATNSNVTFDFISDPQTQRILERDYAELQSLDPRESTKCVIVLSGGIIEGLLLDALVASGHWTFDQASQRHLKEMIYPAKSNGIIRHDVLTDILRVFRNLIHPAREIKDALEFSEWHARHSRAALDLVIREVRDWHIKRNPAWSELDHSDIAFARSWPFVWVDEEVSVFSCAWFQYPISHPTGISRW